MELTEQEKAAERRMESEKSFESWKSQKDEKTRNRRTLYTYNQKRSSLQELPWCPARTLHTYAKTKDSGCITPAAARIPIGSTCEEEDSYSLSFESEAESNTTSSHVSESSGSSVMDSVSRTVSPSKGTRKTIHVCCQTLHYWCTCDQ